MTEALATLFEGKEVRVINNNGDIWVPLTDLAAAWGVDQSAPYHIVERNPEVFGGLSRMSCDLDVTATSGRCVNERGLYLLMGKISAGRLKNPEAKAAIIRFQRWVPELIQQYRKKELAPVQQPGPQELDEVIAYDLIEARQIADLTGTDPKAMQAAILRKHGYNEIADVLNPPAPAYVHGEPGWYTPTGLVALCNDPILTPERLNQYLANYRENGEWKPFQYRDGKIWRLTKRGMEHGREYQFNLGNGHSEPRISWRESVLYASGLKRAIASDQAALPAMAGVR